MHESFSFIICIISFLPFKVIRLIRNCSHSSRRGLGHIGNIDKLTSNITGNDIYLKVLLIDLCSTLSIKWMLVKARYKKIFPTGNWTPVSRVTGGDTHHYTIEDSIIKVAPFADLINSHRFTWNIKHSMIIEIWKGLSDI